MRVVDIIKIMQIGDSERRNALLIDVHYLLVLN